MRFKIGDLICEPFDIFFENILVLLFEFDVCGNVCNCKWISQCLLLCFPLNNLIFGICESLLGSSKVIFHILDILFELLILYSLMISSPLTIDLVLSVLCFYLSFSQSCFKIINRFSVFFSILISFFHCFPNLPHSIDCCLIIVQWVPKLVHNGLLLLQLVLCLFVGNLFISLISLFSVSCSSFR